MQHKLNKHHVLVVGGGFGGIKAALELSKHDNVAITLLSDRPDFRYYPTLYHTATGGARVQSSIPLTTYLHPDKVKIVQGTAEKIDRKKKTVTTREGETLSYDALVLALGMVTNYFGIKGLDQYAYGIKSSDEALRFKAHLHEQLIADGEPDTNYVVIGGGPTGIELAAALPSYLRRIMRNHGIKNRPVHVSLIESSPRLLPRAPEVTSRRVEKHLRKLGIQLYLGQAVQAQTADSLTVNGEEIKSHSVVWTAGVTNSPFFAANNFALNERGKVAVDEYMRAEPDIYVIGDNAATPYSGMAQTALHDAIFVAGNLGREYAGQQPKPYHAKAPITVVPAGPMWAAVDWGKVHIYGPLGWLLRSGADWLAFYDMGPWWKAFKQWGTEFLHEESCPQCSHHQGHSTKEAIAEKSV